MKAFRVKNVLTNAVFTFIISNLVDKKDKQHLIAAFKAIDKDNNGTLNRNEIENYFAEQMSKEEIDELMANIDMNENGQVNYTEFINATIDKKKALTKEKLKAAFEYFDMVIIFIYLCRIIMGILHRMRCRNFLVMI